MITQSARMMRKSFEKTCYRFEPVPVPILKNSFGIYVHVPFCLSKCSFCPFYKELYDEGQKARYVAAIRQEIAMVPMHGQAKWIYFGGGTPNLLDPGDLESIVSSIQDKVQVDQMGIELLPAIVTPNYVQALKALGFTKISIGVESLTAAVMQPTGRQLGQYAQVQDFIAQARALDLWVNVDLMVGLPQQTPETFLADVQQLMPMQPSQITIYPFMIIRGLKAEPGFPTPTQFDLIETAHAHLKDAGYARKSIWTFAQGDEVYDSSRDELIEDYAGFGPAAFSTYGSWKVVNPELSVYLKNIEQGERWGFVAPKLASTDAWRLFARRIYDLKGDNFAGLPLSIQLFTWLLKLSGYIRRGELTAKGTTFAHTISKTVVEALPFPVQNPACVENYADYVTRKAGSQ